MTAHNVVDVIRAATDQPLPNNRHDVLPTFPLDTLPPFWRGWCREAAQSASAPVDYTALSLITVAASLVGGARRISPTSTSAWREPCVLWTALVGGPGSSKTRGMQTALDLVRDLQQRLGMAGEGGWRRYAAAREGARAVTGLWRRDLRNMVIARSVELDPLPDDAIEPPPPGRLIVDDPRIRAVAAAVHGNPRGVLLAPDALDGWLARTARQTADVERHQWRRAWSAERWTIRHRQLLQIDVPAAVSILGTLRPDALPPTRAGDDDGLIGRCLFVCPSRPVLQPLSAPTENLSDDAIEALARLHTMSAEARDVPLTADALDVFEAFRGAHDADLDALEGREAAWWSEGAGMVLRLAGVLTFLDWSVQPVGSAEPTQVSAAAMRTAVDLWQDYLWPHARAAFGAASASKRRHHAERVLQWLAAQGLSEVSREQIRRVALSQDVDADGADAIIALLVEQGWLQPVARKANGPGRPPMRWQVNPAPLSEDVSAISATDFESRPSSLGARASGPLMSGRDARAPRGRMVPTISATDGSCHPERSEGFVEPSIRTDGENGDICVIDGPVRGHGTTGPSLRSGRQQQAPTVNTRPVPAISATDSDAKTYRHPERSEGSLAKDARYAMSREIPRYARDDDGVRRVPAISAADLVDAEPLHVR